MPPGCGLRSCPVTGRKARAWERARKDTSQFVVNATRSSQMPDGDKRWSDVYQPHSRGYTAAGEEFSRQLKNQRYLDGLVVEKNPVHALAVSAQGLAMIGHH